MYMTFKIMPGVEIHNKQLEHSSSIKGASFVLYPAVNIILLLIKTTNLLELSLHAITAQHAAVNYSRSGVCLRWCVSVHASLHRGSLRTHGEPHRQWSRHNWAQELVLCRLYLSCDTPEQHQPWHLCSWHYRVQQLWQPFAHACTTESSLHPTQSCTSTMPQLVFVQVHWLFLQHCRGQ